jgi:hypothetical protein
MVEGKIQVSARITKTLYDKCIRIRENITVAIVDGLELLVKADEFGEFGNSENENTLNSLLNSTEFKSKNETEKKDQENENKVNTYEFEIKIKKLETKVEEKEALVTVLRDELTQAHRDKEILQNLYDNYMRQMQTLIQQKAIKAPGEENKKWWKFW